MVEVLAPSQDVANAVLAMARTGLLHADFEGRLCEEGNTVFPFSPSDIESGALYRFSVFHTLEMNDLCEIFPIEHERARN